MEEVAAAERPHILAIPLQLLGHMTPVVQLCRILIATAGCRVSIVCTEREIPSLRRLLPEKQEELRHMKIVPISDGFPLDVDRFNWNTLRESLDTRQEGMWRSLAPHIQSFSDVVCLISDVYYSWTQDLANQLGIPHFAVWVAAASEYQVFIHANELVKAGKLPFKAPLGRNEKEGDNMLVYFTGWPPLYHRVDGLCEEEEEIKIHGLPNLNRRDFPTFLQIEDDSDVIFKYCIEHFKPNLQASMVLFNSFEAVEGRVLDAMRSKGISAHTIGPLFLMEDLIINNQVPGTQSETTKANGVAKDAEEENTQCLGWLNGQKPKSVMYVAFGSLQKITEAEAKEIALGLLYSGQPFIWVYPKPREGLPEGFLDQVKGKGLVLEWAPQARILSHPSTGAFFTHCGWNSTMESICSGVPTLCLPAAYDQYLHCKMMVEEWKVGLRLERSPNEHIALADDISQLTQELLVGAKGEALRNRAQELKLGAKTSIHPGGSSRVALDAVIKKLIRI